MGGNPLTGAPSIEEMAHLIGTNAYEVIVGIRHRVPRIFVRDGEAIAARSGRETSNSNQSNSSTTPI